MPEPSASQSDEDDETCLSISASVSPESSLRHSATWEVTPLPPSSSVHRAGSLDNSVLRDRVGVGFDDAGRRVNMGAK